MQEEWETTVGIAPESLGLGSGETLELKITRTKNNLPAPDPVPDPEHVPVPEQRGLADEILALPEFPKNQDVDQRDVVTVVHNGEVFRRRFRDYLQPGTPDNPGTSPAVALTLGTRGTVNSWDEGAQGKSIGEDHVALMGALNKVRDGGKLFIPFGKTHVEEVSVPGHKDLIFEGETELGAELVGSPGKDMLVFRDDNTQRRLQNRPIFRNLRFFMRGNGRKGDFSRITAQGWQPGAACLAWTQDNPTADGNRKQAWGNSYVTIQNCTARGDKDAIGATFLYSDRALYGLRVQNLFIGDHGTDVSGLHGGLIMGVPPFAVAEYAPDEMGIDHFVHWGGQCSIAISNIANGHIRDHKAYACRWPIHLTSQENVGPRDRARELELNALYYDNDVIDTSLNDQEMMHLAVDNCTFGTIHFKGSRQGRARPTIELSGSNIRGGIFALYSSASHQAPQFRISGKGHQFAISTGGLDSGEKRTLLNGKSTYQGVEVL